MKTRETLRWILAPCLLLGGAALLVADSAEPLPECDDVAPIQRSYEAQLTCEEPGEWTEVFEGHLSFALTNPRDVRGTGFDFDTEGIISFSFEDHTIVLDFETDTDIEGLSFPLVDSYSSWDASCPDTDTATVRSLAFRLDVDLARGGDTTDTFSLDCFVATQEDQQDITCSFLDYGDTATCDLSLLAMRNDL